MCLFVIVFWHRGEAIKSNGYHHHQDSYIGGLLTAADRCKNHNLICSTLIGCKAAIDRLSQLWRLSRGIDFILPTKVAKRDFLSAFSSLLTLYHEVLDDSVKCGVFVSQRHPVLLHFSRAELSKILGCPGHDVSIQLHKNTT